MSTQRTALQTFLPHNQANIKSLCANFDCLGRNWPKGENYQIGGGCWRATRKNRDCTQALYNRAEKRKSGKARECKEKTSNLKSSWFLPGLKKKKKPPANGGKSWLWWGGNFHCHGKGDRFAWVLGDKTQWHTSSEAIKKEFVLWNLPSELLWKAVEASWFEV